MSKVRFYILLDFFYAQSILMSPTCVLLLEDYPTT